MLYVKSTLQGLFIFGIASVLAYAFGFHLLFAHTAIEAFIWAGYYFGSLIIGTFLINKVLKIEIKDKTQVAV